MDEQNKEEEILKQFVKEKEDKKQEQGEGVTNIYYYIHQYINESNGIVMGDGNTVEEIDISNVETVNPKERGNEKKLGTEKSLIEDWNKLSAWIPHHLHDYRIAFLITMLIFQELPYQWVHDLASLLHKQFEENETENISLPRTEFLKEIGAEIYYGEVHSRTGKVRCEFVKFKESEYVNEILSKIWIEFADYREPIINWLQKTLYDINVTRFYRTLQGMSIIARTDFYYYEQKIIPMLFRNGRDISDIAISKIMIDVYSNPIYQSNIYREWNNWNNDKFVHHSFAALNMVIQGQWDDYRAETAIAAYLDKVLKELDNLSGKGRNKGYFEGLETFFAIGVRKTFYYKALVKVMVNRLRKCEGRKNRDERMQIEAIIFILLQVDYELSHVDLQNKRKNKEMIFFRLCLNKDETIREETGFWWKSLRKNRVIRPKLNIILKKYLSEYKGCNDLDVRRVKEFLQLILGENQIEKINYYTNLIG